MNELMNQSGTEVIVEQLGLLPKLQTVIHVYVMDMPISGWLHRVC